MSLSTTIKSLQDIMRKDAGVDGDAQRIGQLGWLLFFKIYSDLELEAEIEDQRYVSPIPKGLHWSEWADQDTLGKDAPTGEALIDLVENQLFPKLKNLDLDSMSGKTRERGALLRGVFEDAFNYMKNGTLLRQVINKLNADIDFNQSKTRHLFGDIYEQILRDLQSAGNAGEFYTPRAATQFAVQMIDPQLGEKILDPACGTGGFLTHSFSHVQGKVRTPDDLELLKQSIHGVEKKSLPHLLCVTNMMIHGIEVPSNIRHDNTLARPLRDYGKADQVDIILTNPPFGGMEEDGIESNFPTEFRTRETADLFLVLVMELLKDGGRAAIVLPDGTLFGEGIKTRIKKKLLEECNLHTIVRLPNGVFAPYTTIRTNILFFTKGEPTKEVWYYEHPYPDGYKSYSKTKPMRIDEFAAERAWWTDRKESARAWRVSIDDIAASGYNLDTKNPNTMELSHEDSEVLLAQFTEAAEQVRTAQTALQASLSDPLSDANDSGRTLLDNLGMLAAAPGGIERLRELVVDLGLRGKLVHRADDEGSVEEMLKQVRSERATKGLRAGIESVGSPPHDLPKHWTWTTFGWVTDSRLGKMLDNAKNRGELRRYLRNTNVQWFRFMLDDIAEMRMEAREIEEFELRPGDLLICEGGEPGRVAICDESVRGLVFQKALHRSRPLGGTSSAYLAYLLWRESRNGRLAAAFTGATIKHLTGKSLATYPVPLAPVGEQERIVAKIDELMRYCDNLEASQRRATQISGQFAVATCRAAAV